MASQVKYGRDEDLERRANHILSLDVGDNKRSIERDIEKVSYERGFISEDELKHYDPRNNWDAHDSAFSILTDDITSERIDPSICDGSDGNMRARNEQLLKRQHLMKHVKDSDSWGGPPEEVVPFLGDNGDRKLCSRCGRSKTLDYFSPDRRGRYGRDNWCKKCRMGQKRDQRERNSNG